MGRELDSATVGTGIALALYNEGNWSYISLMFQGLQQGDAEIAFLLADSYNGREGGRYADRSLDVYFAVTCAEGDIGTDDVDMTEGLSIMDQASVRRHPRARRLHPAGVGLLAVAVRAAGLPDEFDAEGAPPILVIGTTNDPATPYAPAVALSQSCRAACSSPTTVRVTRSTATVSQASTTSSTTTSSTTWCRRADPNC